MLRSAASRDVFQMGVAMIPGSTSETATPNGRSSTRSESAAASSANFDAAYAPMNGSALRPATELMNTMRPAR